MELDSFTRGHLERWLCAEVPDRYQDETRQRILQFCRENPDRELKWDEIDLLTR